MDAPMSLTQSTPDCNQRHVLPQVMRPRYRAAILCLCILLLADAVAAEAPSFTVVPLALLDAEHRSLTDGARSLVVNQLPSGVVLGTARSFNGDFRARGDSVWVFEPWTEAVTRVGLLTDDELDSSGFYHDFPIDVNRNGMVVGHTETGRAWYRLPRASETEPLVVEGRQIPAESIQRLTVNNAIVGSSSGVTWAFQPESNSYQEFGLRDIEHQTASGSFGNTVIQVESSGVYATGTATRFVGQSESFGQSAWVADIRSGETRRIGLFDAEHFSSDLAFYSRPTAVNQAGYVVGFSKQYNNKPSTAGTGTSTWLYDPVRDQVSRLGWFDAEHTNSALDRSNSVPIQFNSSGVTVGTSERFLDDGTENGQTTWIFDPQHNNQSRLGLMDAIHTQEGTGYRYSLPFELTDAGDALGISWRFQPNTGRNMGVSAWKFERETGEVIEVGPSENVFSSTIGTRSVRDLELLDNGNVLGVQQRYRGSRENGWTPWIRVSETGETTLLELTGQEFQSPTRFRNSSISDFNSHYIVGSSERFCGDRACGDRAWFFDATENAIRELGLEGDAYYDEEGAYDSRIADMHENGLTIGYNRAFNGDNPSFDDAWAFDPRTQETHQLQFSVRSDGLSNTTLFGITSRGVVLGEYSDFDDNDQWVRNVPFQWSVESGMQELDALISQSFDEMGIEQIVRFNSSDEIGQRFGFGELVNMDTIPLLMRADIAGDIDGNLSLDTTDIDLLSEAIRRLVPDTRYDLNDDGIVSNADRIEWIFDIARTLPGDANLDGSFDSSDLVLVFRSGQYQDEVPLNSGWAGGDWNGDGEFQSDDLVLAFQQGAYESDGRGDSRAQPIPEPPVSASSIAILFVLLVRHVSIQLVKADKNGDVNH